MKDKKKHIIYSNVLTKEALKQLNELGVDLTLFIVDKDEKLIGVITDGDIRRGLIRGLSIDNPVKDFMNTNFRYLEINNYSLDKIDKFKKEGVKILPILNKNFVIHKLINFTEFKSVLPIDALIMAGGKGERLLPLTSNTPKPMLHVGDRPIIEHNINRLNSFGIENIYISIKYLGKQIQDYFKDGSKIGINIEYINEVNPLGTIGSLSLITNFKNDTILVMNSDLLTNIDFEDFYRSFITQDAAMAIASVSYTMNVPFAVLETLNENVLSFKEKPNYNFITNAGMYLLKKSCINHIPNGKYFNATDLIEKLIEEKEKVVSYKILGYWLDIGRHEDYLKAQEDIKHLKL